MAVDDAQVLLDEIAATRLYVNIDVGVSLAVRVHEALEQQLVRDRINRCDPDQIRDQAACRATPPQSHPDRLLVLSLRVVQRAVRHPLRQREITLSPAYEVAGDVEVIE